MHIMIDFKEGKNFKCRFKIETQLSSSVSTPCANLRKGEEKYANYFAPFFTGKTAKHPPH